jgi:hypothetical protein
MKRVLVICAVGAALTVAGSSARASVSACPTTNAPNELVLVGGSGQQAQLGKPFGQTLQVRLANTNGCPLTGNLAGVTVNFDAPGSGASGIFASSGSREAYVGTDAEGTATAPPFTANYTVGDYAVDAHSDYGSVGISLSNTANGLPASIVSTGTTSQEATVGAGYGQPLQARVTDANGNPVQGVTVAFALVPGPTGAGASFLGGEPSALTDSNGLATSPPFVANGIPGRFTATASTAGVSTVATFDLDNHAATTTLQKATMRNLEATVGTRYRSVLQARLLDSTGRPIEGATVNFSIASADSGAGAAFVGGAGQAAALTDARQPARSPQRPVRQARSRMSTPSPTSRPRRAASRGARQTASRPPSERDSRFRLPSPSRTRTAIRSQGRPSRSPPRRRDRADASRAGRSVQVASSA